MTGMKITAGIALLGGTIPTIAQLVDPKDLGGLNPSALSTLVTLTALGVLSLMIFKLAPVLMKLVTEVSKTSVQLSSLCETLSKKPCLIEESKEKLQDESISLLNAARHEATQVLADAAREAIRVINEAKRT